MIHYHMRFVNKKVIKFYEKTIKKQPKISYKTTKKQPKNNEKTAKNRLFFAKKLPKICKNKML